MSTHTIAQHGPMRDSFWVWGFGVSAWLTSVGHWVQGLVSVGLGLAGILSCGIACVRLYWDWLDRRGKRRAS